MKEITALIKQKISQIWKAGGIHVIFGNFLNKFVVFFGTIFVVRLISKTEYGGLSYLENLFNIAYIFAGLGVSNAVLRFVVLENSVENKKSIFDFAQKVSFIFDVILTGIICIVNFFYPHEGYYATISWLLYILAIKLPAQYNNDNCLTLQRAMFDNRRFAYYNLALSAGIILAKLLGALSGGLKSIIFLEVIFQYVFCVVITISNRKKYFIGVKKKPISNGQKKSMIIYSVQYMITNGVWSLFMLMDVYLLGNLISNPDVVADYKVAYTWPGNISIICSAIGMFITPYFVQHEEDEDWVRNNFRKLFLLNFMLVAATAGVMIIFAKPLIFIYAGSDYYNVIPLMRVITIASLINNGLRYMTANCLAAMGKIKANMAVSIVGILMQIVLNTLLIPKFGVFAPAYVGIIVYLMMAIVLFVVFNKRYQIFSLRGSQNEEK